MASSQNKMHTFDFEALLNVDINQQNWKSIKKKLEEGWAQLKLEVEEGMIEAEAEKYVAIFNKIFAKAELPEIGLDDLREDLDGVAAGIEKALSLINNIDTSALKGIEDTLDNISDQLDTITSKIGKNVQKSTKSAIASVSKLDEALSKIGDSTKDIEDVLKFEGTGDARKQSRELNKLSEEWEKLEDARIESVKAGTTEDIQNWVKRQQAMIKFVRAYKSYAKIVKNPKEEYTQLYNKLLPKSHDAELNLTNLLDRRAGTYSPKTEPWARESTLKEVRDILKNGITVSGGEKKEGLSKAASSTSESSGTKDVSIKNSDMSDSDKLGRQTVEQNQRIIQQQIQENERKILELEKDIAAQKTYKMYKGIGNGSAAKLNDRRDVYEDYGADYYASDIKQAESYATDERSHIVVAEITPVDPLVFDAQKYVESGDYADVLSSPEFLADVKTKLKEKHAQKALSEQALQRNYSRIDKLGLNAKDDPDGFQKKINLEASSAGFDSVVFDNVLDFATNTMEGVAENERASVKKQKTKTIAVLQDEILKILGFHEVGTNKSRQTKLKTFSKDIPNYYYMPNRINEAGDDEPQTISDFSEDLKKKIELEAEVDKLKKQNTVLRKEMSSSSTQIADRIEVNANNTRDEQGADGTTSAVPDNTKAIQSYEQLNTVLQEYLNLEKQKKQFEYTDEDNKWNSIEDIYRVPNSADEIKGDFDTQWKRILNVKNSIKKGYDSYLDPETKSSKALRDSTLEEENQKLESIALAYVNNTDANLDLLNKTQRRFVDGIANEYNTWETDFKKRKEPYNEHNDPIENRSLEIESQITNSASVGKYGDVLHVIDNVKMLGKIDTAAIEQLAEYLGIKVPEAVKVAKTSIDDLNDSLEQTDQLEQKLSANGTDMGVDTDDASSAAQAKFAELQEQKNRELAAKDAEIEQLQRVNDAKLETIRDENTALKNDLETVRQQLETAKNEIAASQARETEISKKLAEEEALIQELRKQLANIETGSGEKAESIGIDDLKKALGDVTYKVKISHDDTDKQSNKIAIDEQTLKNVLNNITFNVNLIQDNNQGNGVVSDVNSEDEDNQSGDQQKVRSQWQDDVRTLLERIKIHTHNTVRQLRGNAKPSADAVKGSVLNSYLTDIKQVLTDIDKKIVAGTKGNVGNPRSTGPLFDARKDTQYSSLSLSYAKLEANGKLTDEIEEKWMGLWDELDTVQDYQSLQLWQQKLTQVNNSIQEILIANNLMESKVKSSFRELINITEMYNKMAISAERASNPDAKNYYNDEANQLLVERQRLLNGLMLTQEQQAEFNTLEDKRRKKINEIQHNRDGREKQIHDAQVEAEAIKRLVDLYEKLGRAQAAQNSGESSRLRSTISVERSNLTSVDYATDMKFKHAKSKGFNDVKKAAEKRYNEEQEETLEKINRLYQERGVLVERINSATGNLEQALKDELVDKDAEILKVKKLLSFISPDKTEDFTKSFERGKSIEFIKQYEALAKKSDTDEAARLKKIASLEKEIGKLSADRDLATDDNVKNALEAEIKLREDLIKLHEKGLEIDAQKEAYDKKSAASKTKQAKSDAKTVFNDAKKTAQKEAMLGKTRSAIGSAETAWMNIGAISPKASAETNKLIDKYYGQMVLLRKEQEKLRQSDSIKPEDRDAIINHTRNLNKMTASVKSLTDEYQRLSGDNVDEKDTRESTLTNESSLSDYKAQLSQYIKEITYGKGRIKDFNAETKTLTYVVKIGKHEFTEYTAAVRRADNSLVSVQRTTKKTETFFEATARKMKELTSYFSGMAAFNFVKQELRRGIQYIREIDSALTELKKVTNATEQTYDKFLDTAAKTADKAGSTIKEIVNSTADWARLNI